MVILVHGDDGCNGDDNAAGQTTCAAKIWVALMLARSTS